MSKSLVVYFSASGVTKKLAGLLANIVGADLHEIIPEVSYSKEDLDWTDNNSRSSVEMRDKSFRPKIKNKVSNMEQYDVIYLGFPIWWYVAPTIINTFLESYDLNGKVIVPFATSGGSDMGNTNAELEPSCSGANLKEGKRFRSNVSESEIKSWLADLKL